MVSRPCWLRPYPGLFSDRLQDIIPSLHPEIFHWSFQFLDFPPVILYKSIQLSFTLLPCLPPLRPSLFLSMVSWSGLRLTHRPCTSLTPTPATPSSLPSFPFYLCSFLPHHLREGLSFPCFLPLSDLHSSTKWVIWSKQLPKSFCTWSLLTSMEGPFWLVSYVFPKHCVLWLSRNTCNVCRRVTELTPKGWFQLPWNQLPILGPKEERWYVPRLKAKAKEIRGWQHTLVTHLLRS